MPTPSLKPSELATMTEDQLGACLANLRREIRNATGDDLKQMQELRERLNQRLDSFVLLHLRDIDRDPDILQTIEELRELTLQTQKAVQEMRGVKKAIKSGIKILGHADRFIEIATKAVPLLT